MIPFNKPAFSGKEIATIDDAISRGKLSGDGRLGKKCEKLISELISCCGALLTSSGTHALELAALLCDIKTSDEVIMPSYTFVSTANAFVLRGAKIVFVDVRPDTMNIDETLIESAITSKTRAIVPVHYAGVGCEMDGILDIARHHSLFVIEDAAQAIGAKYKEKPLGSFGQLSAFSFHETKNITSGGEGGCLAINEASFVERAEVIREKGTNRSQFFRGEVDKYTWVDIGSSYLPSELQAAYLWAQLNSLKEITEDRMRTWDRYLIGLNDLAARGRIELPSIPANVQHNAHIFYIKVRDLEERTSLLNFLKTNGVHAVFHYVPLHSAPAGKKFGVFIGEDRYTTKESERLLRLPLYYGMTERDSFKVIELINAFFN